MGALAHREVEQAVLALALIAEDLADRIVAELTPEDFYGKPHRLIFESVSRLRGAKKPVDIITLKGDLESHGELGEVGGVGVLAELDANLPSFERIGTYIAFLRLATIRRELAAHCEDVRSRAQRGEGETHQLLSELSVVVRRLEDETKPTKGLAPASAGFSVVRERVERPAPRGLIGVPSGFPGLDKILAGWCPGLITIAARTGQGKTAFALGAAKHAAEFGFPTAYLSMEMGAEELGVRLVSAETGIEHYRVRSGYLSERERASVRQAMETMQDLPLLIDDTPVWTPSRLATLARRAVADRGIKLLIVDYLGLMGPDPVRGEREKKHIWLGDISRSIKLLSRELRLPILMLHQLNRDVEKRPGGRPQLSDLKDSGSIEQDSDAVCFIHRPPEGPVFIVAKHRNGSLGDVPMKDRLDVCRFDP